MLFSHSPALEADPGAAHDEKQWSGRRAKQLVQELSRKTFLTLASLTFRGWERIHICKMLAGQRLKRKMKGQAASGDTEARNLDFLKMTCL